MEQIALLTRNKKSTYYSWPVRWRQSRWSFVTSKKTHTQKDLLRHGGTFSSSTHRFARHQAPAMSLIIRLWGVHFLVTVTQRIKKTNCNVLLHRAVGRGYDDGKYWRTWHHKSALPLFWSSNPSVFSLFRIATSNKKNKAWPHSQAQQQKKSLITWFTPTAALLRQRRPWWPLAAYLLLPRHVSLYVVFVCCDGQYLWSSFDAIFCPHWGHSGRGFFVSLDFIISLWTAMRGHSLWTAMRDHAMVDSSWSVVLEIKSLNAPWGRRSMDLFF